MEKLVVLDYRTSEVHLFKAQPGIETNEDYLDRLGFNHSEVEWISGDLKIISHSNVVLDGSETSRPSLSKWNNWYWNKGGKDKVQARRKITEYNRYKRKIDNEH